LFYNQHDTKLLQSVIEMNGAKLLQPVIESDKEKLQQPVGEFPSPFACVPWGHHIAIISKCKSVDEALFYIGKTIEQGMSRAALVNCCKKKCVKQNG